jgi:hypothetical protein
VGAAAGIHVFDKKLLIGPEVYGSTVISKSEETFTKLASPMEVLFGTRFTFGV